MKYIMYPGLGTVILLISTYVVSAARTKRDYTGHQVLRVHTETEDQVHRLKEMEEDPRLKLDFWSEPMSNRSMDMHVRPEKLHHVVDQLAAAKMKPVTLITDIQELINHENDDVEQDDRGDWRTRRSADTQMYDFISDTNPEGFLFYWFSIVGLYTRHHRINEWLYRATLAKPQIASIFSIGKSYEGRELRVIKIGSNNSENKPAIWIDAGIHAREWIAPATAVYIIFTLVHYYGREESVTRLVDAFDWYILPVANPDGYEYSVNVDRMWRKTRSFTSGNSRRRRRRRRRRACRGVDPNRNFNFHWTGDCESDDHSRCYSSRPCSESYAGIRPFSEPETIAMANFILSQREHIKLYLSLHSYSQLWLTPWAYTRQEPTDFQDLMRVAMVAMEGIQARHGTEYLAGSPAVIIYSAGGASFDWAKAVAGIKYSFTIELRDTGRYGFLLPRHHIVPTGEETWEGIKAAAFEVLDEIF